MISWQCEPGSCRQHAKICLRCAVAMLFSIAFIMSRHTAHADTMKLSSSQPGNLWIDGQSERFSSPVPNEVTSAQARVTDYWGREVYNEPITVGAKGLTVSLPRLQPGWYMLTLTTAKMSTNCTFGIVLQADTAPGSHEGSVCADAAAAWQLEQSQYEQFSDVVKAIGLPMVRERMW